MKNKVNFKLIPIVYVVSFTAIYMLFNSCNKKTDDSKPIIPNNNAFVAEKTDVNTYEIVNLSTKLSTSAKYNGLFGTTPIALFKTSDSTVAFIVPDLSSGQYELQFDSTLIKFNLVKTQETNPDQLVTTIFESYDLYVSILPQNTEQDKAYIETLKKFKQDVSDNYNSQTTEQKKLTALFYTANKDLFKSFDENLTTNLDEPIQQRQLSECPETTKEEYGECVAEILGSLAEYLNIAFDKVILPFEYNEISEWEIPFWSAIRLRLTEKHNIIFFRDQLGIFIEKKWILNENLFDKVETVYADEAFTDMNIQASYRPIDPVKDEHFSSNIDNFFLQVSSLRYKWNILTFLGPFPDYNKDVVPIRLQTDEIIISNISKPDEISIADRDGESVKFNNKTDQDVYFSFDILAKREGFFRTKTAVYVKVEADADSTAIYHAAVIGNWKTTTNVISSGELYYTTYETILANGIALRTSQVSAQGVEYTFDPPTEYGWSITHNSTGYYWIFAGVTSKRLTYPLTQMITEYGDFRNFHEKQ